MCFGAMNPALWNYDIQKNSGGRAAIVLLPLLMPDAILLGQRMPGEDFCRPQIASPAFTGGNYRLVKLHSAVDERRNMSHFCWVSVLSVCLPVSLTIRMLAFTSEDLYVRLPLFLCRLVSLCICVFACCLS